VLLAVTMGRVPMPNGDEVCFGSAAYSIANGGSGVPTIFADEPAAPAFPRFYGPVSFRLGAWSFRALGVSIVSFRLVGVLGVVLLGACAAAFSRVAGASWPWSAAVFSLMMLTPEVGNIATSGRMDALALGLEMAGLWALAAALASKREPLAWALSAGCGLAWGLAVLTTPRVGPYLVGVAAASPLLLWHWSARSLAARFAVSVSVVLAIVAGWCAWIGTTPLGWFRYVAIASIGDPTDVTPLLGGQWHFGFSPQALLVLAGCVILAPLALLAGRARGGHRTIAHFALAAAVINTVVILALLSTPAGRVAYCSLPLLVATLALAAQADPGRGARRVVAATIIVGAAMGGVRVIKYVEVLQSWEQRDGRPLEAFLRAHLSPDAVVYGPGYFYFYAITRAGGEFRVPMQGGARTWVDAAIAIDRAEGLVSTSRSSGGRRFVVWPQDFEAFGPVPARFSCARPVAVFTPRGRSPGWLDRLPAFGRYTALRQYPSSALYEIPDDCRP
jgi:4-amino-4-deoxy-L-arabinose transferase-like glycosyltransferase